MIAGVPDYLILMAIAIVGVAYKQISGWIKAKQADPTLKFDIAYLDASLIACVAVAMLYADPSMGISAQAVIMAFLSGYAGQKITTETVKLAPTPGK